MKKTRVPESLCTNCGKLLNGAGSLEEAREPQPDDASICLYCGHIMVFGEDLRLRDPTLDEVIQLAGDPDIIRTQRAIAVAKEIADE